MALSVIFINNYVEKRNLMRMREVCHRNHLYHDHHVWMLRYRRRHHQSLSIVVRGLLFSDSP